MNKDLYARTNNICLVLLTILAVASALVYTKPVLLPFIFSIFLYSTLAPLVGFIQAKTKIPRPLAIAFSFFLLVLLLSFIVVIFIFSIEDFISGADQYSQGLTDTVVLAEHYASQLGFEIDFQKIQDTLRSLPLFSYAQSLTTEILSMLGNIFLILIFTIFMIAGSDYSKSNNKIVNEILNKISLYVSAKFILSLVTGFSVWLVLALFNVELAFIFGLLTVLLNFIPTIGSIMAVALPIPILLLQFQFQWSFFIILALTGLIQFTIGNIIEPKMIGDSMDLHPITVLIGLMFWGLIWGVSGMFLAVPITAILKIVFSRIDATKPFSEILAGRLPSKL